MMTAGRKPGRLFLLCLALGALIALIEYGGFTENRGALLMTLVFWTGVVQGAVAVVAVAELVGARWVASLRRELLALSPLMLFLAVLFPLLWPQPELYSWAETPGRWLNGPFFLGRNLFLLLLAYLAARRFVGASLDKEQSKAPLAVVYLFVFVASQSLVAFDWVMSLEAPWYSTLFGAYFFIEALYGGIALAGILFFLFRRGEGGRVSKGHLRDIANLAFGFSILWAGLFFAQYLLIWYGNLPEEAGYVARRVSASPFRELSILFLCANFLVPFFVLLSARAKRNAAVVFGVSASVLLGIFLERLLFILPVVSLQGGAMVMENGLFLLVVLYALRFRGENTDSP